MVLKYFLFFNSLLLFSCKRDDSLHPQRKNIVETVYASGKIQANNEYTLYALSSGTVKQKLLMDGDPVEKDQVIYIIDHAAPAARLDAAKTSFSNAESNLSANSRILSDLKLQMLNAEVRFQNDSLELVRLTNLIAQDVGTQSAVDKARATYQISLNQKKSAEEKYYATSNDLLVNLQNARSQLTGAKSELDNYFIRSEARGILYQALKEQGEAVHANEAVAILGERDKRVIRLAVDQQDIDRIVKGQEVLLRTDVTGGRIYKAVVDRIYPLMNEADQTFRVDAVFADSTVYPYIHSSVEANIIIRRKANALVIPRNALVSEDAAEIREGMKIRKVSLQLGIQTLDEVEVLGGLSESSELVIPKQK